VERVTRDRGWEEALASGDAPCILAMREDDLPGALERFPEEERDRLILVQNGFLEAVLGPLEEVTRGLIWFTSKGDFYSVLLPSPFHGPHAGWICDALESGGVPATCITDREEYLREMILKGVWNCVVGLPLAVHETDLGTYLRSHQKEMEAVVAESTAAASAEYGLEVDPEDAVLRILQTTGDLGWVRGGAKALDWRNGAVARFGRRHGVPTGVTDDLLRKAGHDPESA
jgi:hypothetical protein